MAADSLNVPGSFCWVELTTPDPEAAKRFYGGLLGWAFEGPDGGEGSPASTATVGGAAVGGIRTLAQATSEAPPGLSWLGYVAVESVDEATMVAAGLGADVIAGPLDVGDAGRMASLLDPEGATVGLWEAGERAGIDLAKAPGALFWNELASRDVDMIAGFYATLFDWELSTVEMGAMRYTQFVNEGTPAAGMLGMTAEWGDLPSHWMVYFAVEDCDASCDRVTELGGRVCVPATDIPPGRFAVVEDPQGATFSIIKPSA
jgi:predicted enzyme related to lactoylglutathione lyase